jgi:hypothetical protein
VQDTFHAKWMEIHPVTSIAIIPWPKHRDSGLPYRQSWVAMRSYVHVEYKCLELVISVKTFKTKLAEKRRQEYTDGIARKIGIGVVRVKV